MPGHDIIVIGASAGGVEALVNLAGQLPRDLPAAIFVVLHIPADNPSLLSEILSRSGRLPASQPVDKEKIRKGHIYVAAPDYHLLIERDHMRLVRGPKENRHRPAIDPLFRSAAYFYGPRVVGVILTGSLGDGTAGLLAVKRRGVAIVQDPHEATYPSMPASALAHVHVDYCLPLSSVGATLTQLAHQQVGDEGAYPMPDDMEQEENASLSRRLARRASERGQEWLARSFEEKWRDAEQRALTIRQVLKKEDPATPSGNGAALANREP